MGENISSLALKLVLRQLPLFLSTLVVIFRHSDVLLPRSIKNVSSPVLKLVLRHLPFFMHFDGYFASIGHMVPKIRPKTFLRRLWYRFYGICRYFWSSLLIILRRSYVLLPRHRQKHIFAGLKTFLRHLHFLFVHFSGSFASIWHTVAKIRSKTFLNGFETVF